MGQTANDEEAQHLRPLSPPAAEDDLPLYEESQATLLPSTSPLEPPDPKATPDEVRDFLVAVMLARGIGPDHARRVAARWTLGTGRELRSYPVAMFRDIFGSEDGWAVYKDVRVMIYTQDREKERIARIVYRIGIGTSALMIVGSIGLMFSGLGEGWVLAALFFIFVSVLLCLLFVGLLTGRGSPEEQAERELGNGWSKAPSDQGR